MYDNRGEHGGQCTISDDGKYTAEWRVDLGKVVSISQVDIYYRKDFKSTLLHFYRKLDKHIIRFYLGLETTIGKGDT